MGGAKRSRSAQAVAAERAVLTDLGAIDDPFAERMLDPAMARILWGVRHLLPGSLRRRSVTLAGLAARVRFHDAQVVAALDDGIDQVVVLGAGYDSRAWRLARPGVRCFELDHPLTQEDKRRSAPPGGPTYVAADLRSDSAVEALVAGGLDVGCPVVLVLEGVTMYLPEEVVRRQLRSLADACAAGSRLSTDFYPPADAGTAGNQRQNRLQQLARRGSGEGLHLTVSRSDAEALVASCGWSVTEAVGARAAARALVPAAGLPVDAVNDHKTLLAARR
ncbi:MAG TPA: SAM-dependent methyltransferase [Acidimicrobiales bacterium]|jgi:methyltransferase (TIGR00027 family)|nr:SAM-dependent methyltransferase [Acidimicrobiales bacterium]